LLPGSSIDQIQHREALREQLLAACDAFTEAQKTMWRENGSSIAVPSPGLFGASSSPDASYESSMSPSQVTTKQQVLELVEQLAALNPTPNPTEGWKEGNNVTPAQCKLNGAWKLRFTTAADATFKPGKRGEATTMQYVNSTEGTLTNVIEFKQNKGKLRGFKVIVEGSANSNVRMDLKFKRVVIERKARSWSLFKRITIPFPDFGLFRRLTRQDKKDKTPHFNILYVDDELRIHKTGDDKLFVQSRLYDVWDPMKGWTLVGAV